MSRTVYTTLITPAELAAHLGDSAWAIVDCRFSLDQPHRAREAYRDRHIPGAQFAHLEDDLSGPVIPGATGRHPLPAIADLSAALSRWGIDRDVQVVGYDDAGGSVAARLWWSLRWLGHDAVAVLNGGLAAWEGSGFALRGGEETRRPRRFVPRVRAGLVADAADVEAIHNDPAYRLLDARSAERYRGERETIDPVAGHIPGAISLPYAENLRPDGSFKTIRELRTRFAEPLRGAPGDHIVCYCGSGVTAAHDALALAYAGFGDARLYVGSWSDWICDPARPVARGAEPRGEF